MYLGSKFRSDLVVNFYAQTDINCIYWNLLVETFYFFHHRVADARCAGKDHGARGSVREKGKHDQFNMYRGRARYLSE